MKNLLASSLAALLIGTGCSSIPVERMKPAGSILTTGGEGQRFKRVSQASFKPEDRIIFITNGTWEPVGEGAGAHDCVWQWYAGETMMSKVERRINFSSTPFEVWSAIPASVLKLESAKFSMRFSPPPC
jgi:hypothetical protein